MNIQEIQEKCKALYENHDLFFALVLVLVALISFGLGRQSVSFPNSEVTENAAHLSASLSESAPVSSTTTHLGGYVASKKGTKYHLPWCAGAQQTKEENKVWFSSKEEAEAAGYAPAENCKGI